MQTPHSTLVNRLRPDPAWVADNSPGNFERLRELNLISVFRHDTESLNDGVVTDARFAGVATLTFALSESGHGTSDAWLKTTWHDSTRSLMSALEPVVNNAGMAHEQSGVAATVVFSEDLAHLIDPVWRAKIRSSAAVAGVDVKMINLSPDHDVDFLAKSLSRQPPNQLLMVGAGGQIDEVARAFGSGHGFERVVWVAGESADDVLQYLRERFAAAVGVSLSLQVQLERDTRVVRKQGSAPFPFAGEPAECLHLDGGHRYLRDPSTGLYWTRDTANHADVLFKTYQRRGASLCFESDRNAEGDSITAKHKGPTQIKIDLSRLNPCSSPGTHKA